MTLRICPDRDAPCPHGMECPFRIDNYHCERKPTVTDKAIEAARLEAEQKLKEAEARIVILQRERDDALAVAEPWRRSYETVLARVDQLESELATMKRYAATLETREKTALDRYHRASAAERALAPFVDAYKAHNTPDVYDLDDEQPVAWHVQLGAYRRASAILRKPFA